MDNHKLHHLLYSSPLSYCCHANSCPLFQTFVKTYNYCHPFYLSVVPLWTSVPEQIISLNSCPAFKKHLRHYLDVKNIVCVSCLQYMYLFYFFHFSFSFLFLFFVSTPQYTLSASRLIKIIKIKQKQKKSKRGRS